MRDRRLNGLMTYRGLKPGLATGLLLGAVAPGLAVAAGPGPLDFSREILPILSEHCFQCHGPDEGTREAKLRLDTREGIFRERDGFTVVVPGKPEASEMILRITSEWEDEVMPPPETKKKLQPDQVALLKRWVAGGAPWNRHWAYEPPQRPEIPMVGLSPSGEIHPIDAFVRKRLEREEIAPSPEADRRTLFRRLSLDLRGLPPEPQAARTFTEDRRPDAYERAVDAMLASPHFGERWGRYWLDLARYADSGGYLNDTLRPYAYLFRDWVINALNRDQPFDQFTIEQLAGDLLPHATLEQKIATGFHRNSLKNDEAGADLELDRTKAAVDRTATTGSVWLGLTVGCAECHTHKYDPITQTEFYRLYAFFNNTDEVEMPAPRTDELAAYHAKLAVWETERLKREEPLQAYFATVGGTTLPAWERTVAVPAARWQVLAPEEVTFITEDEERMFAPNADHSISPGPKDPFRARYLVKAPLEMEGVTGFRLEALAEPGRPVGRSRNGGFSLAEFTVLARTPSHEQRELELASARADFEDKDHPATYAADGEPTTGWRIAPQTTRTHVIVFELKEPQDFAAGTDLYLELEHRAVGVISRFRLSATSAGTPLEPSTMPDAIVATIETSAAQRTAGQTAALARYFAEHGDDEDARKLFQPIAEHAADKPEFPKTKAPILGVRERRTHLHVRGDYQQPGDEVQPGTLEVLHPFHPRGPKPDRLDLARWLVDPSNPLTARVTVNQIWKNLFGRGLVATVDNFGSQGERPSHPELLDYLATEFIRLGWSRKQLIRLIVTSATYRQTSASRPDLVERDPLNVLLARQGRHRLEAEIVRDVFLANSGMLNPRIGGPSIYPPLPAFVTAFGRNRTWPVTEGPEQNRRGLYIHLRRNVIYPMLLTFDASDTSVACLQRERSNSPLQALTLLNDPVFFACSEKLGETMAGWPASLDERLARAFERSLGRPPRDTELQALRSLHDDQLELLGGDARMAMVTVARVLMNLDEFITRE